jgi:hypothetical protein
VLRCVRQRRLFREEVGCEDVSCGQARSVGSKWHELASCFLQF